MTLNGTLNGKPRAAPTGARTSPDVFTTTQVARICRVAIRTVAEWVDSGLLRGYYVPGTRHRRVTRENLVRFLRENAMPLRGLEPEDDGEAARTAEQDRRDLRLVLEALRALYAGQATARERAARLLDGFGMLREGR